MIYMKEGDTSPALQVTLKDSAGSAVDVTGATVRFHMRPAGSTTTKVDAAATIVTAASGIVKYSWASGDTDTLGVFQGEFEVTYANSAIERFPNDGYLEITIKDNIA